MKETDNYSLPCTAFAPPSLRTGSTTHTHSLTITHYRLHETIIYGFFLPLPFAHYTSTLYSGRRSDIYIYILKTTYVYIYMFRYAAPRVHAGDESIGNIGIYEPQRQHKYTTLSVLAQRGLSIHCVCIFRIFLHYPYITP